MRVDVDHLAAPTGEPETGEPETGEKVANTLLELKTAVSTNSDHVERGAGRLHRARQREPVEHLLLARVLDVVEGRGRATCPSRRRPARRRGGDRRACRDGAGRCGRTGTRATSSTTRRARCATATARTARAERGPERHHAVTATATVGRTASGSPKPGHRPPPADHASPVAVDRQRDDGDVEARPVVVEEEHGVHERVRETRVVQRLVRVGDVDLVLEQRRRPARGRCRVGRARGTRCRAARPTRCRAARRIDSAGSHGFTSRSPYARTVKAGMTSSRKFSYWSSPTTTSASGAKSSITARTRSQPATSASRWRDGCRRALVVGPLLAHLVGPARRLAQLVGQVGVLRAGTAGRRERRVGPRQRGKWVRPTPSSSPISPLSPVRRAFRKII